MLHLIRFRNAALALVAASGIAVGPAASAQTKVRDYPQIWAQDEYKDDIRAVRNATTALAVALRTAYDTIGSLTGRDMNPVIDRMAQDLLSAGGLSMGSTNLQDDIDEYFGGWASPLLSLHDEATSRVESLESALRTAEGALMAVQEHADQLRETQIRMAISMGRLEDSDLSETEAQQLAASILALEAQELTLARHNVLLQINMEAVRLGVAIQNAEQGRRSAQTDAEGMADRVTATPVPLPPPRY
jgi:hypothetical protein